MRFTLLADDLFDGERWHGATPVTVDGDRVVALGDAAGEVTRVRGSLVPGFIDVQVNGGGGVLFNDAPAVASLTRIGAAHARFGTTAFLPTVMSDSIDTMARAVDAVSAAIAGGAPGVLGIHFEGPHLSAVKRGVHRERFIRPIGAREWELFARRDIGVRVVTVAPETVSPDEIARLVALGVRVCLGHSNADCETVRRALQAGARGFTHLYNAMSPVTAREPGMVGVALLDDASWCGLILDGQHVHDDCARLALRLKRAGKVFWVSDAMPPLGSEQREFDLLGAKVTRTDGQLRDERGALAGSDCALATAVRRGDRRLQLPLGESLRMASRYPADFLELGAEYARIAAGARADLVLLDGNLEVAATWIWGRQRGE